MSDPLNSAVTTERSTSPEAPNPGTSRRQVLRAAGVVALVGGGGVAFAACSSDSATPAAGTAPSSGPPAAGPSVTKAEVPVGGGIIMGDADYVVTQPEAGTYKAFSKKCTHQGCPVKQIVNKEIVCNCHGSHFSISDGSVISGPAKAPLPEAKATVSGDKITISA